MVEDTEALRMVEYAVERVMARQHPGRPAFYALLAVHREVRRARAALAAPVGASLGEALGGLPRA